MSINQFFIKKGPFPLNEIAQTIGSEILNPKEKNIKVHGIESLDQATDNDLTFLNVSC